VWGTLLKNTPPWLAGLTTGLVSIHAPCKARQNGKKHEKHVQFIRLSARVKTDSAELNNQSLLHFAHVLDWSLWRQVYNLSHRITIMNTQATTKYTPYVLKLKDPRWQKKRLEVMDRNAFTCSSCYSKTKTLNVHHPVYEKNKEPRDYPSKQSPT
jgi:hypothetical protein